MKITFEKNRVSPYCVTYYVHGDRKRLFFKTKADAQAMVQKLQNDRARMGVDALVFDPKDRADYAECKRLLAKFGVLGLVSTFVSRAIQKPENRVVMQDFRIAYDEYFAHKVKLKRRAATLSTANHVVKPFCELFAEQMTLDKLKKSDVERYVVSNPKWSPRTCRNVLTCIVSFLNFCHTRDWLSFDPNFNNKSILPKELKKPVEIFDVSAIESFFAFLENSRYKDLCGYFAIQAFCGLRHAEADRIDIDSVDFENRVITISAEFSKTGDMWTLRDLPENLWAWLEFCPRIIVPSDRRIRTLKKRWGGEWKHNGLWHTFATMHVSLHQNPAKTSLILRHRNQQRLWQNYLANPVAKEEAERYFAIVPAGTVE